MLLLLLLLLCKRRMQYSLAVAAAAAPPPPPQRGDVIYYNIMRSVIFFSTNFFFFCFCSFLFLTCPLRGHVYYIRAYRHDEHIVPYAYVRITIYTLFLFVRVTIYIYIYMYAFIETANDRTRTLESPLNRSDAFHNRKYDLSQYFVGVSLPTACVCAHVRMYIIPSAAHSTGLRVLVNWCLRQ